MILVTGAAGFIGSNFVLDWLAQSDEPVVNLDALTYAGNLENLASLEGDTRHIFIKGSIGDFDLVAKLLAEYQPRAIKLPAARSASLVFMARKISFRPTSLVPSTCSRLSAPTGMDLRMKLKPVSAFYTSQPTKFTAHSPKKTQPSPKPTATNQTALTQLAKPPATISSALTTIPTACRY